jgi:hypothetical protein
MPSIDYTDERKAMRAKTAHLRTLRLAKEAEGQGAADVAPVKKPARAKPAKKKRPHAARPW